MRLTLKFAALVFLYFIASGAAAQDDKVRINGVDAGEEVLVAMSARKAPKQGCFATSETDPAKDETRWIVRLADSTGHVSFPNLERGCVLTVAAFSQKRAMLLKSLSGWRDQGGEVKTVTMKPPIDVPVMIWVAHNDLQSDAERHAALAVKLYRESMVGFKLIPTFRNVSGDSKLVRRIDLAVLPHPSGTGSVCCGVATLKGYAYKAKTVNVYYVKRQGLHRNCAIRQSPDCQDDPKDNDKADANVTYLDFDPTVDTDPILAHELAHAFGLRPICTKHSLWGHVQPNNSGFDETNIMVGQGTDKRVKFTLGQIFRMNTAKDEWGGTMVIANKLRPGPGRACRLEGQAHSTFECPPLNLTLENQ